MTKARASRHQPSRNASTGNGRSRTAENSALLLTGADVARLMAPSDYLEAVAAAFRLGKQGAATSPAPMHIPAAGGGFHAKGAALLGDRKYVALKLNGNFPGNARRRLPTIQGVVLLCDAEDGRLLAIIDSIEITLQRTAAASALAARHLARPDASVMTICGCGAQASAQVMAMAGVRTFRRGLAWDIDPEKAVRFAVAMHRTLGIEFEAAPDMRAATRAADVIVTCTTARTAFLDSADVSPGVFIAAVGADNPEKSEIAPPLMAAAKVVVDSLDQCLAMGDLHHAVRSGAMSASDVHGDLGEVVTSARPGRSAPDEIIIFDSTGTAIQDVASAALAYERAVEAAIGTAFTFAAQAPDPVP